MRFDSATPRTWLLAGTAAWAIAALVLALLGMGREAALLPDDPALLRPLPQLPKPVPERLGPLGQYAETASRPLFADDRRPHPFSLQPEGTETQAKAFDYVLTSVIITPTFKMAILKAPDGATAPLRVRVGEPHEQLPGWQLQSIGPRSAVFIGPEGERTLELGVFDGVGGEAPTVATTAPAASTGTSTVPGDAMPEPPPMPAVAEANTPVAPPSASARQAQQPPQQQQTEQAQMDAIRRRIEARRAQLRQEALQEQQQLRRQNQKPPVK
jgi:general secretion pathway protein N